MPYIRYSDKGNGIRYASLVRSVREGGRVKQEYVANLGRVIDADEGVFKSRERGVFRFTVEGGFEDAPERYRAPSSEGPEQEGLILDFGDVHFLYHYMRSLPFYEALVGLLPGEDDTLLALLCHRILADRKAVCHAKTWWEGSYASVLLPDADLEGPCVDGFLGRLGDEAVRQRFFDRYLGCLYGVAAAGARPDGSSAPKASRMSVAPLGACRGDGTVGGAKLVYVLDRVTGRPLCLSCCPGGIVGADTLKAVVGDLGKYGVSVDYAVVDPACFSEGTVRELDAAGIPFITRLAPHGGIFRQAADSVLEGLMSLGKEVRLGDRLLYTRKARVDVYGKDGYAYLAMDVASAIEGKKILTTHERNQQMARALLAYRGDEARPAADVRGRWRGLRRQRRDAALAYGDGALAEEAGEADGRVPPPRLFMALASVDVPASQLLPLCYAGQRTGQPCDIGTGDADLRPLRLQEGETSCGHLILAFIAAAVLHCLQEDIVAKGGTVDSEGAFMALRNRKCKVYPDTVIAQEPTDAINEIYRLLEA
ncbi:MAG: hypothetical protein LBL86_09255 [Coriobacteriales bacterium]|jgi:hypothetical protein|nr:hypothetical protein [Coriobacteriales bacterium]